MRRSILQLSIAASHCSYGEKGEGETLSQKLDVNSALINVDAKIASKAIALNIKKVIGKLVHSDQTAYVCNRNIGESAQLINDILEYKDQNDIEAILFSADFEKPFDSVQNPGGGHTSISLTEMLVREQISTTQKSRMNLNSNPKKIECSKIQTQKNRITQDAMLVEVRINMKSYCDFMFFSTVCSSCKGFRCVTQKMEDPKK